MSSRKSSFAVGCGASEHTQKGMCSCLSTLSRSVSFDLLVFQSILSMLHSESFK